MEGPQLTWDAFLIVHWPHRKGLLLPPPSATGPWKLALLVSFSQWWLIHSESFSYPLGSFTVRFEKEKNSFAFKSDENHLQKTCVHNLCIYAFLMDA